MCWARHNVQVIVLMVCLLSAAAPHAARAQHGSGWLRGTFTVPLGARWSVGEEFQLRRQNIPGDVNVFQRRLLWSFRQWANYRYSNHLVFSLSPFAYFRSHDVISDPSLPAGKAREEVRFTAATALDYKVYRRFSYTGRYALEYRHFPAANDLLRLRLRNGLRCSISKVLWLNAAHELMLADKAATGTAGIDQHRLSLSPGVKILPGLTAEAGYMYIARVSKDGHYTGEHNAVITAAYGLRH